MASDNGVGAAKQLIQMILPKVDMPGLSIVGVDFDFVRQSYKVAFSRNGKGVSMMLAQERIDALKADATFAARRLRKELEATLGA